MSIRWHNNVHTIYNELLYHLEHSPRVARPQPHVEHILQSSKGHSLHRIAEGGLYNYVVLVKPCIHASISAEVDHFTSTMCVLESEMFTVFQTSFLQQRSTLESP